MRKETRGRGKKTKTEAVHQKFSGEKKGVGSSLQFIKLSSVLFLIFFFFLAKESLRD